MDDCPHRQGQALRAEAGDALVGSRVVPRGVRRRYHHYRRARHYPGTFCSLIHSFDAFIKPVPTMRIPLPRPICDFTLRPPMLTGI